MTVLFLHIQYLLRRHDCVIVPGLGAFIATEVPARIDMEHGRIVPPSRQVSFNQALKDDDGLLVNSLARKNRVTFDDARMALVHQVSQIRRVLTDGGEVVCGSLGSLRLQEEGQPVFTGSSSPASGLGFQPVHFGRSAGCAPVAMERPSRRYWTPLKVAVMMFLLLSLAIGVLLFPIPNDVREQRASVVPVDVLRPQAPPSATEPAQEPSATPAGEPEHQPVAVPTEPEPNHYLIVATFRSPREAANFIAIHAADGFPMTAVQSRTVTRISIASSSNRDELRRKLNSHEVASRFPQAWIWSEQ